MSESASESGSESVSADLRIVVGVASELPEERQGLVDTRLVVPSASLAQHQRPEVPSHKHGHMIGICPKTRTGFCPILQFTATIAVWRYLTLQRVDLLTFQHVLWGHCCPNRDACRPAAPDLKCTSVEDGQNQATGNMYHHLYIYSFIYYLDIYNYFFGYILS